MGGERRVQLLHAVQAISDAPLEQDLSVLSHHADVVVGLGPVDPDVDHCLPLSCRRILRARRRRCGDLMDQCSWARHPTSRLRPLAGRRGHALNLELGCSGTASAHPPAARAQHALRTPSSPIRKPLRYPLSQHAGTVRLDHAVENTAGRGGPEAAGQVWLGDPAVGGGTEPGVWPATPPTW